MRNYNNQPYQNVGPNVDENLQFDRAFTTFTSSPGVAEARPEEAYTTNEGEGGAPVPPELMGGAVLAVSVEGVAEDPQTEYTEG